MSCSMLKTEASVSAECRACTVLSWSDCFHDSHYLYSLILMASILAIPTMPRAGVIADRPDQTGWR